MTTSACARVAARLNAGCQCVSLDRAQLAAELERESPGFSGALAERPHLFSDAMVFVGNADLKRMAELVAAVDEVVALPAYREQALARAPVSARHDPGTPGVFLGYDFHVGETGPQLIEINTNAGGGLLNAVLARAQRACCDDVKAVLPGVLGGDTPDHLFIEMFRTEWRRARGDAPLTTVAIVDIDPDAQYLHPEFVLFQRLFERHGLAAAICDPAALTLRDGALWHGERRIDLVYNRLTDFYFESAACAALREAYLADAAVITPHPLSHALYADKRNLVPLSDAATLRAWGVAEPTLERLVAAIPRTELVTADRADDFWARRRQLFFKPAAGYGSKAAYRGDKLTKRVFEEVMAGDYIAQALVPPSSRRLAVAGETVDLKLDLRNYVYAGAVQLVAARLWQGQTTNFRTPGGGFAPVLGVSA